MHKEGAMTMTMSYDCIVVGAGMSGLGAAYELFTRGASLLLLEAGDRVGGAMRSERTPDGFVLEHGPNTVVNSDPSLWAQFDDLGLGEQRVIAGARGSRRYLVRRGQPVALPASPGGVLGTPLLSPQAKLRLLAEPFMPRAVTDDESALVFVARRLGAEPARRFLDPFVSGIYAGDPAALSMRAAFPRLWQAEQRAGSLLLGLLTAPRDRSKPKGKRELFSFAEGLGSWPQAVAQTLGPERVWLRSRVVALSPAADGWQLRVARQDASGHRETVVLHAADVILAVPAFAAADLVAGLDQAAATALRAIPYPPLAVVHLGYHREDVAHPLDGFGMLCPAEEHRHILGSLWPSTLFEGRAPQGMVLLTMFVGGVRAAELARRDDAAIIADVRRELAALLGARGLPTLARVIRWEQAIPQYLAGHERQMAAVERMEAARPGLRLLGNYRGGVSVGQCWLNGRRTAAAVRLPQPITR